MVLCSFLLIFIPLIIRLLTSGKLQLDNKFLGKFYIIPPTGIDEINSMVLNKYFHSDSVYQHSQVLKNKNLIDNLSQYSRTSLVVFGSNKVKTIIPLNEFLLEDIKDSIINVLNEKYLSQSLSIKEKIIVQDNNYSLFLNNAILSIDQNSYFLNTNYYNPSNLWKLDSSGGVLKFQNLPENIFNEVLQKLDLPRNDDTFNFNKFLKFLSRNKLNNLELTNAIYSDRRDQFDCFGNFNFSRDKDGNVVYFPVFFTLDKKFNLLNIYYFDRRIPPNYYAYTAEGLKGIQYFRQIDTLHIKVYDPDFLPDYYSGLNEDFKFLTSASFVANSDTITYLQTDNFTLTKKQRNPEILYFNNWSSYHTISDTLYLLYYNDYNLLQANYTTDEALALNPIPENRNVLYSFDDNNSLYRIAYDSDDYYLYKDRPHEQSSQSFKIGSLRNPTFNYRNNILYIYEFLRKKTVLKSAIYLK